MSKLQGLIRENIRNLRPYSSARDEFIGKADIFMDANENPFDNGINRYPDPTQTSLRETLAKNKMISPENIFLGNGSDEVLDIIYRVFCEPREDNIVTHSPTYGMYSVLAKIHDVELRSGALSSEFQLDPLALEDRINARTKILIFCSPNNPSGNNLDPILIEKFLISFSGIVLIDEAYMDYSFQPTWLERLAEFPRLIVMQTFSKAWGAAGIRLGMAFAAPEIINRMNTIKPPYNVNDLTVQKALTLIRDTASFQKNLEIVLSEKTRLGSNLRKLEIVKKVFPSDANFLLVRFSNAAQIYTYLAASGVIVRNKSEDSLCEQCLRITIGRPEENAHLLALLKKYKT